MDRANQIEERGSRIALKHGAAGFDFRQKEIERVVHRPRGQRTRHDFAQQVEPAALLQLVPRQRRRRRHSTNIGTFRSLTCQPLRSNNNRRFRHCDLAPKNHDYIPLTRQARAAAPK